MNEPIKIEGGADLPMVNRNAFMLEPTEAFLEWARGCHKDHEDLTLEELRVENTVFLIPSIESDPKNWLKKNYRLMFEFELDGWCTDDASWPEDLSFKNFMRFFNVRYTSLVMDMGKGRIVRDDE